MLLGTEQRAAHSEAWVSLCKQAKGMKPNENRKGLN